MISSSSNIYLLFCWISIQFHLILQLKVTFIVILCQINEFSFVAVFFFLVCRGKWKGNFQFSIFHIFHFEHFHDFWSFPPTPIWCLWFRFFIIIIIIIISESRKYRLANIDDIDILNHNYENKIIFTIIIMIIKV